MLGKLYTAALDACAVRAALATCSRLLMLFGGDGEYTGVKLNYCPYDESKACGREAKPSDARLRLPSASAGKPMQNGDARSFNYRCATATK